MTKQIGYAVVGLGTVARTIALPAFAATGENSRLIALVSGDRPKAQVLAQQYRATAYHYDELRQCLQRDDVHAAYITLPNSLHCDYAVEAARAGVHVLCEPPMAITADECRRMIRTCHTNRVKLMLAYRLAFRPAMLKVLSLVRAGHVGVPKTFSSDYTSRLEDPESPRLQRRLGGGTVYHLGVECIHAARRLFGAEPAQVMAMTARTGRRYGGDVDEGAVALVRFPDDRLAHFHTSFGEQAQARFTIFGEEGLLEVENAYGDGPTTLRVVRGGDRQDMAFDATDDAAGVISHFSSAIREDREPDPSGVDGLQDIRIVEAIYRSSRDGRPVTLPRLVRVEAEPEPRRIAADRRQAG